MLNDYRTRHILSTVVVIALAYAASNYLLPNEPGYIATAAFSTCQTSRSAPLRQKLIIFALLIIVLLTSALLSLTKIDMIQYVFLAAAFLACTSANLGNKSQFERWALYIVLMLFFLAIVTCFPASTPLPHRFEQVGIGAVIGIIIGNVIFPVRTVYEFRQAILPMLRSLADFSQWTVEWLWLDVKDKKPLSPKQDLLQMIDATTVLYPDWIYEVGFNPGLRKGFRSFLLSLEQAADLLFAIEYEVTNKLKEPLGSDLSNAMQTAMRGNIQLINAIIRYFTNEKITDDKSNYEDDIHEMEKVLQQYVPASLELMDVSSRSFVLTAVVRHIKDLRGVLIKLIVSLPRSSVTTH